MNRKEIEAELFDWMNEPESELDAAAAEDRFTRLALALFRFQYDACEPYTRLCRSLDRTPANVLSVSEIPAVPTGAFKEFPLRSFPEEATIKIFRTSGTSTDRRGELHLDTLDLYEASLLASLRRCFVSDLVGQSAEMHFLAPDITESPDSSLSHMFDALARAEGGDGSRFDLIDGKLDLEAFEAAIHRARAAESPLVVAGTSFAFVHFIDEAVSASNPDAADGRWALPAGSRIMETGGFKGRSRVVPRDVLRANIAACFGLDESHILNQYGMTELASQFYDSTLIDPEGPRRKLTAPWTRVRFVDPLSGNDVEAGEVGMIIIHDLANTGSVAAIQTSDLGRAILGAEGEMIGFDVLGREEGAEARGCSIATDVMLDASSRIETGPGTR